MSIYPQIEEPHNEINQEVEKIRKYTIEAENELRRIHQEQEEFTIQLQINNEIQSIIQQLNQTPSVQNVVPINNIQKEKELSDNSISHKAVSILQMRMSLIDKQQKTLVSLQTLQQRVLDIELNRWKRSQRYGNGVPFNNNLDQIQK